MQIATKADEKPIDKAEPKALEILDSIKAVFAAKGFDGASMQDLARAAGMSAGNFYRYFRSKDAIIEAIVERQLAIIDAEFSRILQSPDPREDLLATIRSRIETADNADGPLWSEIEAAASRRAKIGQLHTRMESDVSRYLIAVFARIAGIAVADAAVKYAPHAAVLMMLVHGTVKCRCGPGLRGADLVGSSDAAAVNALVLRMIGDLLSDVALQRAPSPAFPENSRN